MVEDAGAWQVLSAGVWTTAGLAAMPLAQKAATALGVDLSAHLSRPLEAVDLGTCALIITMEPGQAEAIQAEFPGVAARVYPLSRLAHGVDYDVPDPIGRPYAAYLATAKEIDELLRAARTQIMKLVGQFSQ